MAFFSLLFLDESWFQDELRACLIQSQTQKERRRDSAEDITKEYATIRKDLSETERKKKEKMKRLFSMLLLCFVNGPVFFIGCRNVLVPAFLSLFSSHYFFLCQFQKPFFLSPDLHSFPLYIFLSLCLILQSVKAEQTACSEKETAHCQWDWASTFHLLFLIFSFGFPFFPLLSLIKWHTCLLGSFWRGVSQQGTFIFLLLSSPLLTSPVLSSPADPLCVEVWYITPLGIQGGR